MSDVTRVRTVTLVLAGGHLIKLTGAVDIPALVGHLGTLDNSDEIIDIRSGATERLYLRRSALLAVMDTFTNAASASVEAFSVKPFRQIENFLSEEEHQRVLTRALSREKEYELSRVSTGIEGHRSSILLANDDVIVPLFRKKIKNISHEVARSIGLELDNDLNDANIECQITAHRDGGFYHMHNDNGSAETANRVYSYVYYFQFQEHAFYGGELKIYEPDIGNGKDVRWSNYVIVNPKDNCLVCFPSHVMHEVLPTYVPSGEFKNSRFTVNGWVRRS